MRIVPLHEIAAKNPEAARFVELVPVSGIVPRLPDFVFGSPNFDVLTAFTSNHVWLHRQGVWHLPQAQLSSPFLIEVDAQLMVTPWANIHLAHIEALLNAPVTGMAKSTAPGLHVLIAGPGHRVFGHWLADFLPKLYILSALGYDLNALTFVMPFDAPPFASKLLSMFGIIEPQLKWLESGIQLQAELLIPTTPHNGVRGPTYRETAHFLSSATKLVRKEVTRKIFVARPNAGLGRICVNRSALHEIAVQRGFELFEPEKFSLREQMDTFASAKYIVGEYGSALHWSLFADQQAIVCGIRGSRFHPGFIQSAIGGALGQPTGYVFGVTDESDPLQRFEVSEKAFGACVDFLLRGLPFEGRP